MDKAAFTQNATGRVVRIEQPQRDWAFIPNEMPFTWRFDTTLWPLLAEAKQALGTLNGIGQTLPEPALLLRPLQSREAIASSSIEGTYVTPEQLLFYELDPKEPESGEDKAADWREVFNYNCALRHGCHLLKELPICNRVIKEIHRVLLGDVPGRVSYPGEFRRWQVQIGSSGRYIPPPASEVDRLMNNLELSVNTPTSDDGEQYDPLIRAFLVHYQFEAIHPFVDGNGRVGRVLLSLMIQKWMGHTMPWLYLSAYLERFRREYVRLLFNISATGDWKEWVEFCLFATIHQANDSINRCHRFKVLRDSFHERMHDHSKRTHQIIEGLFASPLVTAASIAERFGITYPTAQADIRKLVDAGILNEVEDTYPKSFAAQEVFQIAYGRLDDPNEFDEISIESERPSSQSPVAAAE